MSIWPGAYVPSLSNLKYKAKVVRAYNTLGFLPTEPNTGVSTVAPNTQALSAHMVYLLEASLKSKVRCDLSQPVTKARTLVTSRWRSRGHYSLSLLPACDSVCPLQPPSGHQDYQQLSGRYGCFYGPSSLTRCLSFSFCEVSSSVKLMSMFFIFT